MPDKNTENFLNFAKKQINKNYYYLPEDEKEEMANAVVSRVLRKEKFWRLLYENERIGYGYLKKAIKYAGEDYLKKNGKELPFIKWMLSAITDPVHYSILSEAVEVSNKIVEEVLSNEKLKQRLFFVYLNYYKGLKLKELSEMFDLPTSTIHSKIKAALEQINEILKEKGFVLFGQYKIFFYELFSEVELLIEEEGFLENESTGGLLEAV